MILGGFSALALAIFDRPSRRYELEITNDDVVDEVILEYEVSDLKGLNRIGEQLSAERDRLFHSDTSLGYKSKWLGGVLDLRIDGDLVESYDLSEETYNLAKRKAQRVVSNPDEI